jgi:hypothetical protein
MYFREIGWGGMDGITLDPDKNQWRALVNTVMNLWVPSNVGTFLSVRATDGLSTRSHLHGVS